MKNQTLHTLSAHQPAVFYLKNRMTVLLKCIGHGQLTTILYFNSDQVKFRYFHVCIHRTCPAHHPFKCMPNFQRIIGKHILLHPIVIGNELQMLCF